MPYAPDYPIETHRLRLRPFTRGDVDAVFAYRQRDDVSRFLFDEAMSRESCAEAVQLRTSQVALREEGDKLLLAVERKDDLHMIGEVSLTLRNEVARQGELGYVFNPDFSGAGYATEAARGMMKLGFEGAGMHRIFARCDVRNTSSWALMDRLGMRREAHFREHALFKGTWDEELIYAMLEEEWFETLARG